MAEEPKVDLSTCHAMTDHFEGIDKLVKEAPHTEGAPNFRRVRESVFAYVGSPLVDPSFSLTVDARLPSLWNWTADSRWL